MGGAPTLRSYALGHDRIPNRRVGGRLRRSVILHFAAFRLFDGGAVTQAYFVLLGIDLDDFEIVFAPGSQDRGGPAAGLRFLLVTAALLDFGNMAQTLDALAQFHEGAKGREARDLAANHVVDLVGGEPVGPDIVELLDAERHAAIRGVDLENLGLDRIAFFKDFGGIFDARGPADIAHVDQAVEAFLDFHEGPEFREIAHAAGNLRADRVFLRQLGPGVGLGLLDAERDAALIG